MSTPTPRTDAVYLEHRHWANEDEATEAIEDFRDLARTLERELAAEREKVRALRSALERRHADQAYHCDYVDAALAATEETAPKSDQNAPKLNQTGANRPASPHPS